MATGYAWNPLKAHRSSFSFPLSPFSFLFVCLACVGEEPTTPPTSPAGDRAPFYVLVDYLPQALYEGEPLTACFRIENLTGREAEVTLRCESRDGTGRLLRADEQKLTAAAGAVSAYRKDHDLAGARRLRFSLRTALGEFPGPEVRALSEEEPWPETRADKGFLAEAASGAVLAPILRRRLSAEDRSWAPVRWALGLREQDEAERVTSAWLVGPAAWADASEAASSAPGFVPESARRGGAWKLVGPYALTGVAPILSAVGDILRALPQPAPQRVVVMLPPEDLEAATAPRLYGLAVELLLARLAASGVRQTVLFPPFHYGRPEAQHKALWSAAQEAAQSRQARSVSPAELLDEQLWRLDPRAAGVYGRRPNAEGQKRIGQILSGVLP